MNSSFIKKNKYKNEHYYVISQMFENGCLGNKKKIRHIFM